MAAAVPEGFCCRGEAFGDRFSPETNKKPLYSLDDRVLSWGFRVGQEIANRFPEKSRRRAVGHSGGPGTGPGQRWSAMNHMAGFKHGHYWTKPASVAQIADIVEPKRHDSILGRGSSHLEDSRDEFHEHALPTDVLDEDEFPPPEIMLRWLTRPVYL
jgi:hypothetical protein